MSTSADTVESLLFRAQVPFDQVDPTTWVLKLDNQQHSRVVVKVADPIVLISVPLGVLDDQLGDREALYRTLLELNADLMHNAYAIEGQRLVLSGALQLDDFDQNGARRGADDFQAIIDELTMTLDNHLEKLSPWKLDARPTAEA